MVNKDTSDSWEHEIEEGLWVRTQGWDTGPDFSKAWAERVLNRCEPTVISSHPSCHDAVLGFLFSTSAYLCKNCILIFKFFVLKFLWLWVFCLHAQLCMRCLPSCLHYPPFSCEILLPARTGQQQQKEKKDGWASLKWKYIVCKRYHSESEKATHRKEIIFTNLIPSKGLMFRLYAVRSKLGGEGWSQELPVQV